MIWGSLWAATEGRDTGTEGLMIWGSSWAAEEGRSEEGLRREWDAAQRWHGRRDAGTEELMIWGSSWAAAEAGSEEGMGCSRGSRREARKTN